MEQHRLVCVHSMSNSSKQITIAGVLFCWFCVIVYRIALLSITAAGTGITLTAATVVVFAELYWTPGVMAQCENRAHRIGQRDCVTVKYLLAKGTLDDVMWYAAASHMTIAIDNTRPMIQRKLQLVGEALNGQEEIMVVDTYVI